MPFRNSPQLFLVLVCLGTMLLLIPTGCSDDPVTPPDDENPGGDMDIHEDDGYVGIVIDTRPIFKKGYAALTVALTFPAKSVDDVVLDVDPMTNLAILSIDTDDLTAEQLTECAAGVAVDVVAHDLNHVVLGSHHENALVLDYSNRPLPVSTDLPFLFTPIEMRQDLPYLMQVEGNAGIVPITGSGGPDTQYVPDDITQLIYLTPVAGKANTFWGENLGTPAGYVWCFGSDGGRWLEFSEPWNDNRADLVLEPDEDGWVRIRLDGTDEYLIWGDNIGGVEPGLQFTTGTPGRFRFISDSIDWQVADHGTVFNQPIMPPARLDYAYYGSLRNCSASTLEETIGRSESRSSTTTIGMSESLELFASASLTIGAKVGFSVTAKVGVDIQGVGEAGEEHTVSGEASVSATVTTSATAATGRTWSQSQTITTEVSRTRSLTLPPYTAVKAYDAVKTINNVRIPFTQVLRISGRDKDTDIALTGRELRSQMMFNFVGGVITAVEDEYLDITFRGETVIDKLFRSTTNVIEIEGACN